MLAFEGKGTTGIFLSETVVKHIGPWLLQFCWTKKWNNFCPFCSSYCKYKSLRYHWQLSPFLLVIHLSKLGCCLQWHRLLCVVCLILHCVFIWCWFSSTQRQVLCPTVLCTCLSNMFLFFLSVTFRFSFLHYLSFMTSLFPLFTNQIPHSILITGPNDGFSYELTKRYSQSYKLIIRKSIILHHNLFVNYIFYVFLFFNQSN